MLVMRLISNTDAQKKIIVDHTKLGEEKPYLVAGRQDDKKG